MNKLYTLHPFECEHEYGPFPIYEDMPEDWCQAHTLEEAKEFFGSRIDGELNGYYEIRTLTKEDLNDLYLEKKEEHGKLESELIALETMISLRD